MTKNSENKFLLTNDVFSQSLNAIRLGECLDTAFYSVMEQIRCEFAMSYYRTTQFPDNIESNHIRFFKLDDPIETIYQLNLIPIINTIMRGPFFDGYANWLTNLLKNDHCSKFANNSYIRNLLERYEDVIITPSYFLTGITYTLIGYDRPKDDFDPLFLWQIQTIFQQMLVHYYNNKNIDRKNIVLTDRENSVLKLIAGGKTNPEIGMILNIKTSTVATYVKSIYLKLGRSDRVSATLEAIHNKIL